MLVKSRRSGEASVHRLLITGDDILLFIVQAQAVADKGLAKATSDAISAGRERESWEAGSLGETSSAVSMEARRAREALDRSDQREIAAAFLRLGLAYSRLEQAMETEAQRLTRARERANPGAEARRRKAAAENAPMIAAAVDEICNAGMIISLTKCAEMVCGDKDPSHVRAVLKRSGLFKLGAGGRWVVDREFVRREFPQAA